MDRLIKKLLSWLLFLLPWQTIWMYQEYQINGVKWEYGVLGWYATEAVLWTIVILHIVQSFRRYAARERAQFAVTRDRMFVIAALIFLLYAQMSSFWSIVPEVARQQALRLTEACILLFLLLIHQAAWRRLSWWFVAGCIPVSLLGVGQFFMQSTFASTILGLSSHPVWQAGTAIITDTAVGRWLRAYGSFPHPNQFGGYLVTVLACLFFFLNSKEQTRRERLIVLAISLCATAALVVSFSRSAWLAFLVIYVVSAHAAIKQKISLVLHAVVLALIVLAITCYSSLFFVRTSAHSYNAQQSIVERKTMIGEAGTVIQAHPWRGVGAGNYTAARYEIDPAQPGWYYQPVHMTALLLYAEYGRFGIGLLMLMLSALVWWVAPWWKNSTKKHAAVGIGLSIAILASLDHYLYTSFSGLLCMSLLFAFILWSLLEQK